MRILLTLASLVSAFGFVITLGTTVWMLFLESFNSAIVYGSLTVVWFALMVIFGWSYVRTNS